MKRIASLVLAFVAVLSLQAGVAFGEQSSWERGRELMDAGNFNEAVEYLTKAIADHRDSWELRYTLSIAEFRAGKYEDSIRSAMEARELAPEGSDLSAFNTIVPLAYLKAEDLNFDTTFDHLKKYCAMKKDWQPMIGLAKKAQDAGENEKSMKAILLVAEKDPGNLLAHKQAAQYYVNKKDMPKAIEHFEAIHKAIPDEFGPVAQLVKFYRSQGDEKKAIEYAKKAYEINPDATAILKLLARDAFTKEQWRPAAKYYAALTKSDDSAKVASFAAQAYDQLEEFGQAARFYKMATDRDGSDCNLFYRLGVAYEHENDDEKALKAYEKAISLCGLSTAVERKSKVEERIERKRLRDE